MITPRSDRAAWKEAEDFSLPRRSFSDAYTEAMKASRQFVLELTEYHGRQRRRRVDSLSPEQIAELLQQSFGEEPEEEFEDQPSGGLRLIREDE